MANRYQGLHVQPKTGLGRWHLRVAAAVGVAIVAVAGWRIAAPPGRGGSPAPSKQLAGLFASNATATTVAPGQKASVPSDAAPTTVNGPVSAAGGATTAPPAAQAPYVEPVARWTSYRCVANGFAWEVTYAVRFTGGTGWQSLDGGTTSTEHWGIAPRGPGLTGLPEFTISIAQVFDTTTNQGRFVDLANPVTIHCPGSG